MRSSRAKRASIVRAIAVISRMGTPIGARGGLSAMLRRRARVRRARWAVLVSDTCSRVLHQHQRRRIEGTRDPGHADRIAAIRFAMRLPRCSGRTVRTACISVSRGISEAAAIGSDRVRSGRNRMGSSVASRFDRWRSGAVLAQDCTYSDVVCACMPPKNPSGRDPMIPRTG